MKYSTRFCHFEKEPMVAVGDTVIYGLPLGKMGNTGQSEAPHTHIGSIEGWWSSHWRVSDYISGKVKPSNEQTFYCIGDMIITKNENVDYSQFLEVLDSGLFVDSLPLVTAPILSATYRGIIGKDHYGMDVKPVDDNSNKILHWNRSKTGEVVFAGWDNGYGWSVIICYEY